MNWLPEVFIDDAPLGQERLPELLARLPEWRSVVTERLLRHEDRLQSARAFLLLSEILRKRYGITEIPEFSYGEFGKPYLARYPHIHFNISHCGKGVACVVAEEPVGVDIEAVGHFDRDLAEYVSSPLELREILTAPDPALALTILWTRKESLLKLRGTGLMNRDDIRMLLQNIPSEIFATSVNTEQKYVVTLATLRKKM